MAMPREESAHDHRGSVMRTASLEEMLEELEYNCVMDDMVDSSDVKKLLAVVRKLIEQRDNILLSSSQPNIIINQVKNHCNAELLKILQGELE
jgi:hypothetical protein